MTLPTKQQVVEKAKEMWHNDRAKTGDPSFDIEPELGELRENGYLSVAQSDLMRNTETKNAEWLNTNETSEFQFDTREAMQTTTFISGSRGVGKSDAAMNIVDRLIKEDVTCVTFDSSRDWIRRSSLGQYLTVQAYSFLEVPEQNTIYDLGLLTPLEQQLCIERFCKRLFEHQLNSQKRFFLVFEESQIYFPLNALRSKSSQYTMRVLTTGRNFGISVCAISQFPALIDKELVKHAQQIYIGCTSESNTVKYWKSILGKNAESLKDLENGQFVYYCRNKISTIQIEPYESSTTKTEIKVSVPQIAIPESRPQQTKTFAAILNLGFWIITILIVLGLRGI